MRSRATQSGRASKLYVWTIRSLAVDLVEAPVEAVLLTFVGVDEPVGAAGPAVEPLDVDLGADGPVPPDEDVDVGVRPEHGGRWRVERPGDPDERDLRVDLDLGVVSDGGHGQPLASSSSSRA